MIGAFIRWCFRSQPSLRCWTSATSPRRSALSLAAPCDNCFMRRSETPTSTHSSSPMSSNHFMSTGSSTKRYVQSYSSAYFPTFMWFQCFLWDASIWPSLKPSFPWQFSLRQVVPEVIEPPPLRSSSPSFPRRLHHHHSLANVFVFSSQKSLYHRNLLSCTFLDISPIFLVPLILSFLILSSLVTPFIHLNNILISVTSNFFSCAFFTAHVSAPYIIAGFTIVLYTFLLTLKLILLSHPWYPLPVFHFNTIQYSSSSSLGSRSVPWLGEGIRMQYPS